MMKQSYFRNKNLSCYIKQYNDEIIKSDIFIEQLKITN